MPPAADLLGDFVSDGQRGSPFGIATTFMCDYWLFFTVFNGLLTDVCNPFDVCV